MSEEDDFVAHFREEAAERLERIDGVLLDVEAGRAGAGAIDALFREFHTIKGAAGLVGLDDAYALAHAVEDLLGALRAAGAPAAGVAATLLRAADALRAQVRGEAAAPPPELLDELAALRAAPPAEDDADAARDVAPASAPAPRPAPRLAPAPAPPVAPEPARAIRVPAEKLDRVLDLVGETVVQRRRLEHELAPHLADGSHALADALADGERLLDELQGTALTLRTLPLRTILGPMPRAVRDLAAAEGKEAELEIRGAETELDRVILERLADPLTHLLRNAVHHAIEPPQERERAGKPRRGAIELRAEQRGALVSVSVGDDGRGVPAAALAEARDGTELAEVLARAGFSTAARVTDVAGRGVGLDAVRRHVESVGGRLEVHSRAGAGTRVELLLPLTLALLEVLLLERGGAPLAVPLASALEVLRVDDTLALGGRRAVSLRGDPVPLVDLAEALGASAPALPPGPPAVVIAAREGRLAVVCDRVVGEQQVVVKPLGPLLERVRGYLGAAILGDGRVALIVDPLALRRDAQLRDLEAAEPAAAAAVEQAGTVLVVEDSFTVRELQRSILETAGHRVETARDGVEAWDRVRRNGNIALVITDIDMPRMDGFALLEAIRADPERAALPVVIVTARSDEAERRRGLDAGADAYIAKGGFRQQALLETVERLLGRED